MRERIVLLGAGGHARSCIDVIEQEGRFEIAGLVIPPGEMTEKTLNYDLFSENDLLELLLQHNHALVAVGQIKTPEVRMRLYGELKKSGAILPTIISPKAYVSPHAEVGEGSIVMHGAMINAHARIGANCIINSQALCEHDVVVMDHCHIATAAVLNGGCKVGSGSFVGSNAVLKQGTIVPERSIVPFGVRHG